MAVDFDGLNKLVEEMNNAAAKVNDALGMLNGGDLIKSLTSNVGDAEELLENSLLKIDTQIFKTSITDAIDNISALTKTLDFNKIEEVINGFKMISPPNGVVTDAFKNKINPELLLNGFVPSMGNIENMVSKLPEIATPMMAVLDEITSSSIPTLNKMTKELESSAKTAISAITGGSATKGFNNIMMGLPSPETISNYLSNFPNINSPEVKNIMESLTNAEFKLPDLNSYLTEIEKELSNFETSKITKGLSEKLSSFNNLTKGFSDAVGPLKSLLLTGDFESKLSKNFSDIGIPEIHKDVVKLINGEDYTNAFKKLKKLAPNTPDTGIEDAIEKMRTLFQ